MTKSIASASPQSGQVANLRSASSARMLPIQASASSGSAAYRIVIKAPKLTPARRTASLPAQHKFGITMSSVQAVKEATPVVATWEVQQALPKVAYGQGCYIFDTDGKRYIDGSGG